MQVLLAISILCFLALIWVALSIARYMNASHRRNSGSDEMPSIVPRTRQSIQLEPDFSHALSTALNHMQPAAPIPEAVSLLQPTSSEGISLRSSAEPAALPNVESLLDPRAQFVVEPHSSPEPAASKFPQPLAVHTASEPIKTESAAEGRFFRAAQAATQAVTQATSRNSDELDESYQAGIAARISQLQQRANELQQNVRDISSAKSWNMPPKPLRPRTPTPAPADSELLQAERRDDAVNTLTADAQTADKPAPAHAAPHFTPSTGDTRCVVEAGTEAARKPPQAMRRGVSQRLDRVYAANQDAGDLSDPYQTPRAGINSGMTTTKQARS